MDPKLEEYLWQEMQKDGQGHPFPRTVINDMVKTGMLKSHKQAWRTLEKWMRQGKYDYICSLDLGWKCHDHTT